MLMQQILANTNCNYIPKYYAQVFLEKIDDR